MFISEMAMQGPQLLFFSSKYASFMFKPGVHKNPVSHDLYLPMNLSIIYIVCLSTVGSTVGSRNKYQRTLENHLNSHIIGMGPCHTDQSLNRQAAWYLPGHVQFLVCNAGIIVLAVMNVYVAEGVEMVLECIRLKPLEKPVVNLECIVR